MNAPIVGATAVKLTPAGSVNYIEVQNHRSLEGIDLEQKRKIFSYALAVVLSRISPIPSMPVESTAAYFMSNIEAQVRENAGTFNERIPIIYDIVRDFTQKLWNIRYYAIHNTKEVGSFYPFNFFEIIYGIGTNIDEKTYAYVNEYKAVIIDISNAISRILIEKKESETNS